LIITRAAIRNILFNIEAIRKVLFTLKFKEFHMTERDQEESYSSRKSVHSMMAPESDENLTETPVFPLNKKEMISISWTLFKSGILTSLSELSTFLTGLIALAFVGSYGSPTELGGISLGVTFGNVFCNALLISINQGFGILACRLFGAKMYKDLGVLYQRNFCVIGLASIPLILLMAFMDRILLAVGLEENISVNAGIYLKSIIPSLIGINVYECTKYFLIAQQHFFFQGVVLPLLTIIYVFLCWLFVVYWKMSVMGAGIAKSITDCSAALILILCLRFSGAYKQCWTPWTKECLREMGKHLKACLIIGANLYVEWISYEVSIFIIAALNDAHIIGAHGVVVSLASAFFFIPYGNSISMQAHLSNAMGGGRKYKAQKYMAAGLFLNLLYVLINVTIILTLNRQIAGLFANDDTTIDMIRNMMLIYCLAHPADAYINHLAGVIRTIGREKEVFHNYLCWNLLVGLNCQWIFGLLLHYGYVGVWGSIALAMYLMLIAMIRKVVPLDWDQALIDLPRKVSADTEKKEEEEFEQLLS
jgi:MATE family multidrug resistance protein